MRVRKIERVVPKDTERTAGTDHEEIEWQYDALEGLERVEEWLLGGPQRFGLAVLGGSSKGIEDTYYDTEDWRLYHAGYALRVRREGEGVSEATMKSLVPSDGDLHRRREISEPLMSDEVETLLAASGSVGACLGGLADAREVRRIFGIRTCRRTFDLVLDAHAVNPRDTQTSGSAGAVRVGEVVLDSSEIPLGAGRESIHLTRVEIELDPSTTTAFYELEGLAKAMERDLELRPATTSKYEAGLSAFEAGLKEE